MKRQHIGNGLIPLPDQSWGLGERYPLQYLSHDPQ